MALDRVTAQIAEAFANEHPDFVHGDFRLYAVIRGEPAPENHGWGPRNAEGRLEAVHRADPGECKAVTTANWKGYVESWRLRRDGTLVLESFRYDDGRPTRLVNETIAGDFYLVFKAQFHGPRQYVRFEGGTLCVDRATWKAEIDEGPGNVVFVGGCLPAFPQGPKR